LTGGGGGIGFTAGKPMFVPSLLPMSNASGVGSSSASGAAGEGFAGAASLWPLGGGSNGTGVGGDEGGFDDELFMIAVGRGGGDRATLRVDCPAGGADKVSVGDPERGWAKASKALGAGDKPQVEDSTRGAVVLLSSVGVVAPK